MSAVLPQSADVTAHDGLVHGDAKMKTGPAMSKSIFGESLSRPSRKPRLQSGVLAYKVDPDGRVRILLVRTSRSKRWSIPKGNARSDLSLEANAAKEAFEEAGVKGEIAPLSAGMFRATKRAWYGDAIVEIWVYLLKVTEQLKYWPEKGKRQTKWVSCLEAAEMLKEPLLVSLCHEIDRGGSK
jgi:ADP-ribose pyrophosphatase YjhB (NUDIX family)